MGCSDGRVEGWELGRREGCSEGCIDGHSLGCLEGLKDGIEEGKADGCDDGIVISRAAEVGSVVGDNMRELGPEIKGISLINKYINKVGRWKWGDGGEERRIEGVRLLGEKGWDYWKRGMEEGKGMG